MKKFLYVFFLPILLVAAQRKVLVEVYTATWCSYCPYSSYGLDTLEMNYGDSIVVIKYHPSSSDPFYTTFAVERADYYPDLSGYPTAYFDGIDRVEGGWNGVYSAYRNVFLSRIDSASPINIQLNIDYNSRTRTGRCFVNLTSETKLPDSTYLRYAIVEDSIFYNWQNRNVLRYVLRRMIPDARGRAISLGSGESMTDTVNFSLDNEWIEPYVYFIAFVQNDSSREVIQASMIRIPVDYGKLVLLGHRYTDSIGNNNRRLEPEDSAIFYFTITDVKPYNTAKWVNISISTDDPFIDIETPSMYLDSITVQDTVTISTKVRCTGGNTRFVNLFFEMTSDSGKFYSMDTISVKVGFDSLLVWDGSINKTLRDYVLPYLDELGVHYDFQSQIDSGRPYIMDAYKYLMYYSGNNTPDSPTIALLEEFLDSGVNAFITGQNIASTQDSIFLTNYLRVRFLYDTTLDLLVVGTGNIFYPQDTVFLTSGGSAMNQYSKDVIEPLSDAIPLFYYRKYNQPDSDTVAAVAYDDGTKRVVFFAFGYEGMGTVKMGKKEALRRVLNYLGYSISEVKEKTVNKRPSYGRTIVARSLSLPIPLTEGSTVSVYSKDGSLKFKKTIYRGILDLPEDLANGVYFIKVKGKEEKILKLLLLR